MYKVKTEEEIKKEMLKKIKNTVDKSQNSIIHDAISPAALEFQNTYINLNYVASKLDIENLEEDELEKFIKQRSNIERKKATKATTIVTIEGDKGAKVKKGDLVSTETVTFVIQEDKTIEEKEIEVLVECEKEGKIGNVEENSIRKFPIMIQGINKVTNKEKVTNGYEKETDKELKIRYYERIRKPITSGNKYHYLYWAKKVEGVGDAQVIPLWKGNNTVKVVIVDNNNKPGSKELVQKVQEYIDPNSEGLGKGEAPIGAFCTVVSAKGKYLDIEAKIIKSRDYSRYQIKELIEEKILNYLKSLEFTKNIVSYAKIGYLILSVEGILDYTNLYLNKDIKNVNIELEEVAVLRKLELYE